MLKKRFRKVYKNKIKKIKTNYNNKFKTELNRLICTLNHDIKTPILAQIQSLELLLEGVFGEINNQQREIIEDILKSNYFLYQIVLNAIFLSEFDSKLPELNYESIDVNKQIEDCCEVVKAFAADKGQDIIFKGNKKIKLNADKKLIQQIIFNLLTSSVSSGYEKSKIEVSIKENKDSVRFIAKNKSAYMTKEKINSMFEEKKTTRDFNQIGMSLNLNIVKKLIKAHNWDLVAESKKDNSASFGFIVKK